MMIKYISLGEEMEMETLVNKHRITTEISIDVKVFTLFYSF